MNYSILKKVYDRGMAGFGKADIDSSASTTMGYSLQ